MNNVDNGKVVKLDRVAYDLYATINKAVDLSSRLDGAPVQFRFNTVDLTVTSTEPIQDIPQRYRQAFDEAMERVTKESADYLKTPAGQAELAAAEVARSVAQKELAEAEKIIQATELKIKDPETWEEAQDHSSGIALFAERWGKLMQHEIEANGKPLSEVAEKARRVADASLGSRKMSGASNAMAVSLLSQCWGHGGELYKWNKASHDISVQGDGPKTPIPSVPGVQPRGNGCGS